MRPRVGFLYRESLRAGRLACCLFLARTRARQRGWPTIFWSPDQGGGFPVTGCNNSTPGAQMQARPSFRHGKGARS